MRSLIALSVLLVGCSHSLPVDNYAITETFRMCESVSKTSLAWECNKVTRTTYPDGRQVTVRQLPMPEVHGETVEEPKPPIHTWMTQEDIDQAAADKLHQAMEEAVRNDPCKCASGDPLCPCIPQKH